jgi:cell division protein FtsB
LSWWWLFVIQRYNFFSFPQLFILLAQSVTGAVITIIALWLVAALIGYFTAWFYAKSVYSPVIKGLEADKTSLNNQVAGLKDEIVILKGNEEKLNDTIKKLEIEKAEKKKRKAPVKKIKK